MAFLDETGLAYFWSKIKNKFLAKNNVANNLTTTDEGYALDARQGPVLLNKISSAGGTGITLDQVYPVGSIYMSTNSTSPAKLFGGTWERIYNRFLLAAGSNYAAGSIGGEAKHYLTNAEMPMHTHGAHFYQAKNEVPSGNYGLTPGGGFDGRALVYRNSDDKNYPYLFTEGGDKPHNNMPPYLAVYMWKRTA